MNADPPIYLDCNASTPVLPEVLEAMMPFLLDHPGNPSSQHRYGRLLRQAIETAREQVAELIQCRPDEIIFTSGGTEANNLAIIGSVNSMLHRRTVVTSSIEHPATVGPCGRLSGNGYHVHRIGVDQQGRLDSPAETTVAGDDLALVTLAHANSETGTIQPIRDWARKAHEHGALMHTDAAQSCGKINVHVDELETDLLSIAGHKLYAPKGVGALYIRRGIRVEPVLLGASHEQGVRPGTENVAAIAGLGQACLTAHNSLVEEGLRQRDLRDRLWSGLSLGVDGLQLNGDPNQRLPNTLNVRFPGVSGNALLAACPEVAASTGSACHEHSESASEVILAMGIKPEQAIGSVRLTLGRFTDAEDIDRAVTALVRAWKSLSRSA